MRVNETGVLDTSLIFFHTPSSTAKSAFYYIECAGHYHCNEHYCVSRDHFMGFLMMYIESGRGICEANGREFEFAQGDVVLIDSTRPHIYAALDRMDMMWVHFNGSTSRAFYELLTVRANVFMAADPRLFSSSFSQILDGFNKGKPISEAIVSCTIQSLLTELLLSDAPSESEHRPIQSAVDYIEAHYSAPIDIAHIAQQVNLSSFHFSRRFRQETGFSPHEFLIITRLNVARQLLLRTNRPVKEIAFEVGFNSESHFVNTFRRHMGIAPSAFRNKKNVD